MKSTTQISRTKSLALAGLALASAALTFLFLGPSPGSGHGLVSLAWFISFSFGVLEIVLAISLLLLLRDAQEFGLKASRKVAGFILWATVFMVVAQLKTMSDHRNRVDISHMPANVSKWGGVREAQRQDDWVTLGFMVGLSVRHVIIPILVLSTTGQKKDGIALIFTPIGFLFGLAAKNRNITETSSDSTSPVSGNNRRTSTHEDLY